MIKHHLLKLLIHLSSFGTIFFSIFLASHFNQCYLFLIGKDNKGNESHFNKGKGDETKRI